MALDPRTNSAAAFLAWCPGQHFQRMSSGRIRRIASPRKHREQLLVDECQVELLVIGIWFGWGHARHPEWGVKVASSVFMLSNRP